MSARKIEAFFETTDGSAQVGLILSELDNGLVEFKPCNGKPIPLPRSEIRNSEATCAGMNPGQVPTWPSIITSSNCNAFPETVQAAASDLLSREDVTTGTVYSYSRDVDGIAVVADEGDTQPRILQPMSYCSNFANQSLAIEITTIPVDPEASASEATIGVFVKKLYDRGDDQDVREEDVDR